MQRTEPRLCISKFGKTCNFSLKIKSTKLQRNEEARFTNSASYTAGTMVLLAASPEFSAELGPISPQTALSGSLEHLRPRVFHGGGIQKDS